MESLPLNSVGGIVTTENMAFRSRCDVASFSSSISCACFLSRSFLILRSHLSLRSSSSTMVAGNVVICSTKSTKKALASTAERSEMNGLSLMRAPALRDETVVRLVMARDEPTRPIVAAMASRTVEEVEEGAI